MPNPTTTPRVYIFIDAENIDQSCATQIFHTAQSYGTIVRKEIYGAGIALNEWAEPIMRYALTTKVTIKPNRYKNSSDIALVIGAMSVLVEMAQESYATVTYYEDEETEDAEDKDSFDPEKDTVVIASADSDFSMLAVTLRNSGLNVVGMGELANVNHLWPLACSRFVALDCAQKENQQTEPTETTATGMSEAAPESVAEQSAAPKMPPHYLRVRHIRRFIEGLLSDHSGKMPTTELFLALNELPEYKEDFRTSKKRKPLDYLSTQYSNHYYIGEGEDGRLWIFDKRMVEDIPAVEFVDDSLNSGERRAEEQTGETSVTVEPDEPGGTYSEGDGQVRGQSSFFEDDEADGAQSSDMDQSDTQSFVTDSDTLSESDSPASSPAIDTFLKYGMPEEDIPIVVKLLYSCSGMKDLYNKIRKEFGTDKGVQYFHIIKDNKLNMA